MISYNWTITSTDGFKFSQDGDNKPGIVRVVLPGQGEYKLILTTVDNESNKVQETYSLAVSDPVAIIKQVPDK
ncbi:MAG: hypothetical protein WCG98_06190 [bacterium]